MAAKSTTNNNTPDKVDFSWTDDEIQLLLESAVAYKSQMEYQGLAWEGVRSKYDKIKDNGGKVPQRQRKPVALAVIQTSTRNFQIVV